MDIGITIFIVGMITVFTVLLLVVLTGRVLVNIINRLHVAPTSGFGTTAPSFTNEVIAQEEIAAITAAVQVVTNGRGKVTTIKKK